MKPVKLTVADLMSTAVIQVRDHEPVTEAHAEMRTSVIHHLPVVDDRGRLVGVLSDRDVLRCLHARKAQRVGDIMTRDVVTIGPDDDAHEAAATMLEHKISSLLVVDDSEALIGVVTMTDFVELAHRALLGQQLAR